MKHVIIIILLLVTALVATDHMMSHVEYEYTEKELSMSFNDYYQHKLSESKAKNVLPYNEEKLIRFSRGKTPLAILYIHGFTASRGEGEYVVDRVARKFKANTYYLRLPGHGTTMQDHANTTCDQLLDEAITSLKMTRKLGSKVVVIATSMGGTIATWLASRYPELVDGLVLVSPFYEFTSLSGKALQFRPLFRLMSAVMPVQVYDDPIPGNPDNWTRYWYPEFDFYSYKMLLDLSELVNREEVYSRITSPVLLLYYFKNTENQDPMASVDRMLQAYRLFGTATGPNPLNRSTAIEEGDHVLLSKYVESDTEKARREIITFINHLQQ